MFVWRNGTLTIRPPPLPPRCAELYKDLVKGRSLSSKTFFLWVLVSVYQGGAIMLLASWLFESSFLNIVGITFTALILTEVR